MRTVEEDNCFAVVDQEPGLVVREDFHGDGGPIVRPVASNRLGDARALIDELRRQHNHLHHNERKTQRKGRQR